MERTFSSIGTSGVGIFLAGVLLWPPGAVYWGALAARVGFVSTVVAVFVLCAVAGTGVALVSDVPIRTLVMGGLGAYAIGLVPLALLVAPASAPEYAVVYGGFLGSFVLGASLVRVLRYRRPVLPVITS